MFKAIGENRRREPSLQFVFIAALVLPLFFAPPAGAQSSPETMGEEEAGFEAEAAPGEGSAPVTDPLDDFGSFEEEFAGAPVRVVYDPLRGYNRMMTVFNDKVYFWILRPTARGYAKVVPREVRRSVNRFFLNLAFPIRFVNNVLQLKFRNAGVELTRFTLNTTVGLAGFFDPAKKWMGLNARPEDFGQTLAHYGAGSGFYFVLPFWGPSNLRDTIGIYADFWADPICYLGSCFAGYWPAASGVRAYDLTNQTSLRIGEYETIKKDALDLYIFLRDTAEEIRKKEISE